MEYFKKYCIITKLRRESRSEILKQLQRGCIEINPGPEIGNIKIITVNCNGLTSEHRLLQAIGKIKRRIKSANAIIFLQETHNANLILLENIWQGCVNISAGTGGSRGVITLTTENLLVSAFQSDNEGRYLFTTVKLGDNRICHTANLYSPNNHNVAKDFYEEVIEQWDSYFEHNKQLTTQTNDCTFSIIAGDFNCVIHEEDLQNRNRTKAERVLAANISTFMEDRGLYDTTLRSSNGNNYTWNRGNIFSKIDYIFVNGELLNCIKQYNTIWDLVVSDHAAICVNIDLSKSEQKRGRSYPKLSNLDISAKEDCEALRKVINDAIKDFPMHWDPHKKLDFIKVVIRTKVLEIRARNKITETQLDKLRTELEKYSNLDILSDTQAEEFNNLRVNMYHEEERQAEKLRIMAGIKWREEGERSTKFFLNALKSREAMATLDFLQTESGAIYNQKDIIDYSKEFYKELYAAKETMSDNNFFNNCPKLSMQSFRSLESDITLEELKMTLKTCKDSTPGLDGIPYSYYKIFSAEILPLILDAWKYSQLNGLLPQSQSTSCISLIPKAGKDKQNIKNWRPISLSSCDLKLITKCISIKVGKCLNEIIHGSQMGYVPGRDINFNNRLMRTAMGYCKENKLDFTITSLDAQKAYDSVSHKYLGEVLKAYNFPQTFINIVDLLHSNLEAVVQINGHISEPFKIERGVKQGDALSCALFIISIDPLIRNIENNRAIPSLEICNGCTVKTLAYADDIAVITKNCDTAAGSVFYEYSRLTKCSGLMLNADKTEILNLSESGKNITKVNYAESTLEIDHCTSTTICGNFMSLNENVSYEKNILDKIQKLETNLNMWKRRNLTLNGKMIIIKTYAISQLIFSSQFQSIRQKDVRKIKHL